LRHLLRVASHSDTNVMSVKALANQFSYAVFRGNAVLQDGVHMKVLVMEDLIQNVHTLFDERPSPPSPFSSPDVAETMSTLTYGSSFLSHEPAEVQVVRPGHQHNLGFVGGIPTSTQSSFSSLVPSDAVMESRFTPLAAPVLSPLLGLSSLTEGVETTAQEQVIPEVRGIKAVEILATSTPAEVVSVPLTSVAEWRSQQLRIPPESVVSRTSDRPLSSATSLQTPS